jgi:membrane-bound serine protease (ClpP class)
VGKVQVDLNPSGIVQLGGEQWTAQVEPGAEPIMKDTQVEVVRVDGLRLVVRRKQA